MTATAALVDRRIEVEQIEANVMEVSVNHTAGNKEAT